MKDAPGGAVKKAGGARAASREEARAREIDSNRRGVSEAPEADCLVVAGGGESVAVWGAGERVDFAGVALEDGGACVICEAPEADGFVATGGGECDAVWGAGEGGDPVGVSF